MVTSLGYEAATAVDGEDALEKLGAAPVGAVLVYGGKGAGHVEIRNKNGFASDFRTPTPSKRKLIGVYAKA